VVKQEGDPQEFFDDDRVKEEVAIDDDGNFVPVIDLEVFTASNIQRILPWFGIKAMMSTMTTSLLRKMFQMLQPFLHSTMQGYLKARAGVWITM
jgi:hypothetical protein